MFLRPPVIILIVPVVIPIYTVFLLLPALFNKFGDDLANVGFILTVGLIVATSFFRPDSKIGILYWLSL